MKHFITVFIIALVYSTARVESQLPAIDKEKRSRMTDTARVDQGRLLHFEKIPRVEEVEELQTSIEDQTAVELTEAPDEESDIADQYLAAYFQAKPTGFLIDAQTLLTTREQRDLEAFLNDHAEESSIDIYFYVFGADQRIPSDIRKKEVADQHYSVGKPAAVIYYYIGAPQRSALYLSPMITDRVSAAEQRRTLQFSVMQASSRTLYFDQIEAFLEQMSIRVYWMQRMTQGTAEKTLETIPDGESARTFPRRNTAPEIMPGIPSWMKRVGGIIVVSLCGLLLLWCVLAWLGSRRRFSFPEFEVESRLGGGHAAGIGAVISFSSQAITPEMQRNRMPDYMRRA